MPSRRLFALLPVLALLGACSSQNWSTTQVTPTGQSPQPTSVSDSSTQAAAIYATDPARIEIFDGDIRDRRYTVLGEIAVTLNKLTAFHPDPTRDQAVQRLRGEAGKLGADAVINVEIGEIGLGFLTWASRDAKGRAVRFIR